MRFYKYSSEDGIQKLNGILFYYKNNVLHRDDGPAIIAPSGATNWYKNGKRYRDEGPAIEHDGSKAWMINGEYHRKNGPAIEWANSRECWYYKGKCVGTSDQGYSQAQYEQWLKFKAFL